jgi:hypothetical protein
MTKIMYSQAETNRANKLKKKIIDAISKDVIFPYQIPDTGKVIFSFVTHDGGIREGKVSIEQKI